ncbi:DUF4197 family protein [Chryseobacterium sp. CT-SW4]|uniref:DUF4197 family protein n=1 Tax=Chryseobacterium sp. SW-1 TaxID=3157343 RepID=UPI003B0237BD
MKKYIIAIALITGTGVFINVMMNSCTTIATTDIGMSVIKKTLLNGVDKTAAIYSDKNAFLKNSLIDQALPKELREINSVLQKISPSLVTKEKEYIAEAAVYTIGISKPILVNAINNLNAQDVKRIIQGEKGTATLVLKEKTSQQLVAAIAPDLEAKMNEYGITKTINTALSGNSLLGSLLGGNTNNVNAGNLSILATQQLVDGMFNIIEDQEKNSASILGPFGK